MRSELHKYLKELHSYLCKFELEYVFLVSEESPENIAGDIDVVTNNNRLFIEIYRQFMDEQDYQLLSYIQHSSGVRFNSISESSVYLQGPDLLYALYSLDGVDEKCLLAEYLRDRQMSQFGFFVLSESSFLKHYIYRRISKNDFSQGVAHIVASCVQNQRDFELSDSEIVFNSKRGVISEIVKSLSDGNISRAKLLSSGFKKSKYSVRGLVSYARARICRIRRPVGLVLCFSGPDGVGKTSVIRCVQKKLQEIYSESSCFHLMPRKQKCIEGEGRSVEPYEEPDYGIILSCLKILYLYFGYFIGYYILVYPKILKNEVVIFDRYYYDVICDGRRFRISPRVQFLTAIFKYLPKPNLTLMLEADPNEMIRRKGELTAERAALLMKSYQQSFHDSNEVLFIDANLALDKVVRASLNEIHLVMAVKASRNW